VSAGRSEASGLNRPKLLIGVGLGVLLGAVLAVLFARSPPAERQWTYGRVVGMTSTASKWSGEKTQVSVQVEGAVTTVSLPRGAICFRGDRIQLLRSRTAFGATYRASPLACERS
jgi:hypothetical protein